MRITIPSLSSTTTCAWLLYVTSIRVYIRCVDQVELPESVREPSSCCIHSQNGYNVASLLSVMASTATRFYTCSFATTLQWRLENVFFFNRNLLVWMADKTPPCHLWANSAFHVPHTCTHWKQKMQRLHELYHTEYIVGSICSWVCLIAVWNSYGYRSGHHR